MKRIQTLLPILLLFLATTGKSQNALEKLSKQSKQVVTNTQNTTQKTLLSGLEKNLLTQFKLDGVKSELVGGVLKLKVAKSDFAKLSTPVRTKQGNSIADATVNYLKNGGIDFSKFGIKSVVVEMVRNLSVADILASIKRTL